MIFVLMQKNQILLIKLILIKPIQYILFRELTCSSYIEGLTFLIGYFCAFVCKNRAKLMSEDVFSANCYSDLMKPDCLVLPEKKP